MKLKEYWYAVISAVGHAEFCANAVGVTIIHGSEESVYKTLLGKYF